MKKAINVNGGKPQTNHTINVLPKTNFLFRSLFVLYTDNTHCTFVRINCKQICLVVNFTEYRCLKFTQVMTDITRFNYLYHRKVAICLSQTELYQASIQIVRNNPKGKPWLLTVSMQLQICIQIWTNLCRCDHENVPSILI